LFGGQQQQQQQQQQTQPSAFGNFGQSLNPLQSTASTSNQPLGSSLLGVSNLGGSSSLFAPKQSSNTFLLSQNQQADSAQGQYVNLVQRIESIEQAWNANSPNCRFQVRSITQNPTLNLLSFSSTSFIILLTPIP